jgi:hypothetical protein
MPNKGKEQDHLKEERLGPLRQGQRLDTTESEQAQPKSTNHQSNQDKTHKRAPPANMQLPLSQSTLPLDLCMLSNQNRSYRFPKPVQPVFFNISHQNQSHRLLKPVQPVFFSSTLQKPKNAEEIHKLPLDSWDRF